MLEREKTGDTAELRQACEAGERRAVMFVPLRFVGFSLLLCWFWVYLTPYFRPDDAGWGSYAFLISLAVGVGALAVAKRRVPRTLTPWLALIATLLIASSSWLLFAGSVADLGAVFAGALDAACGLAAAYLILRWLRFYSTLDVDQASVCIVVSVFVSAALYAVVFSLLPAAYPAAAAVLVPASSVALALCLKGLIVPKRERKVFEGRVSGLIGRHVAAYAAYGFSFGCLFALETGSGLTMDPFSIAGVVLGALAVFVAICSRSSRRQGFVALHGSAIVLLGIASVMVLSGRDPVGMAVASVISCAGFTMLLWLLVPFSIDIVITLGASSEDVSAPLIGSVCAGVFAGLAGGSAVAGLRAGPFLLIVVVAVLVIVATVLLYGRTTSWMASDYLAKQGDARSDPEPTGREILTDINAAIGTMYLSDSVVGNAVAVPGDMESRWRKRCLALAQSHDLSPRQTEVFLLLMKGRNADYIAGELVISVHTVKTHISSVYQKFDLHSTQELISFVEKSSR